MTAAASTRAGDADPPLRYQGQRALVAGATGGIGQAIARELLDNGCDVACSYRTNRAAADELVARGDALGRRCMPVELDLRSRDSIRCACRTVLRELGTPHIVVTSAGVLNDRPMMEMEDEAWDEVIETNLVGTYFLLRHLVSAMARNRGGRIVNIASVSGLFGQPGQVNYAASKGGVIAMTRAMARELGPLGITVNALAPGLVETSMTEDVSERARRRFLERIPLRRFARPEDLVAAARLLMEPAGAYVTGQVLLVDGGMTS